MATQADEPKRSRQERLEAQLRENLKRRREQARARRDTPQPNEATQPTEGELEEPAIDRSDAPTEPPAND